MNNNTRTNKKNRSSSVRGGRGKPAERQLSVEGCYTNHRLLQSFGALVGLTVQIQTRTNTVIEGVFTTLSPTFEVVLDMPHLVQKDDPTKVSPETVKKKMIFKYSDIVTIRVKDVDMDYATKDSFQVDSMISNRYNGKTGEKELEPWTGGDFDENLDLGEDTANGWDVDDMFRKNEEFGVMTSYTPEMEGYTTPLRKRNTSEYRQKEQDAIRISNEIENSAATHNRAELENGDEEDRFSAVVRPDSGKYVPPQRRKGQPMTSKQQNRNSPSPQIGGSTGGPRFNNHNNSGSQSYSNQPSKSGSLPPSQTNYSHNSNPSSSHQGHAPRHSSQPPASVQPQLSPLPESKINGDSKDMRNVEESRHESREPQQNIGMKSSESCGNINNEASAVSGHPHHHSISHNQHHVSHHHHHHPPQQQQQQQQHSQPPPQHAMAATDRKSAEPREQREPRKSHRGHKEEQFADLKKFGQDFKLSEPQVDAKKPPPSGSHHPSGGPHYSHHVPPQHHNVPQQSSNMPPPSHTQGGPALQSSQNHPPPPPQQQQQQQVSAPPPPHTQASQSAPPPGRQHSSLPPQHPPHQPPPPSSQTQMPPPTPQNQGPPPAPSQPQPQQQQQAPTPVSAPVVVPASATPGSVPSPPSHLTSPATPMDPPKEVDKGTGHHQLNPDAKEFVPFSNTKPFHQRSPSNTSPPRTHTPIQSPQISQTPSSHILQLPPGPVNYTSLQQTYVFPPFPGRFQKRGVPAGATQRQEYSQVAAATMTGHPIVAQNPTAPQQITAVQPLQMLPQNQPYSAYPTMPMLMRLPPPMMTAVVPTSVGGLIQHTGETQQTPQPQQQHAQPALYISHPNLPQHAPTPGPQPQQPPTPQGHINPSVAGGGGPPNIPTQPPTPGPSTPQQIIYPTHMSQHALPQHLSQQSPHASQSHYLGHSGPLTAGGPQHPGVVMMFPPHPQIMHGPPPPHTTTHIPSTMSAFTSTSTNLQHMNPSHISYLPGNHGNQGHTLPMVHQNQ